MLMYWKNQYCKNIQSYLQIQCNPYQNTPGIFHRNRNVFKVCMQPQKTSNSWSNFEKEQTWRHYALWFQTILQSSDSQNSYGIGLIKHTGQWNRIEKPINKFMNIWQRFKNIQWGKDNFFNKVCWENWTATCQKKKKELEHILIPYTKVNSKLIRDLNKRDLKP